MNNSMQIIDSLYIACTVLDLFQEPEKVNKKTGEVYSKAVWKVQVLTSIPKDGETLKKELHDIKINSNEHKQFFDLHKGLRVFAPVSKYAIQQEGGNLLEGYSINKDSKLYRLSDLLMGNKPINTGVSIPSALSK